MRKIICLFATLVFCTVMPQAQAGCSRTMEVPLAPIGASVIINGAQISGVYPDVLRNLPKKNCQFAFSSVPRARLEALFEAGKADLLIPATRTPRRDELGWFVSTVQSRVVVIVADRQKPVIQSLQDLLQRRDLRVALVRGFDFGSKYQALVEELEKQGRLTMEANAQSVGRLLNAGLSDVTIMVPSIFIPTVEADPRSQGLSDKLRYDVVPEFPWGESGLYISRTSVNAADLKILQELLETAVQSGAVWKAFQQYYKPEVLRASLRPSPSK